MSDYHNPHDPQAQYPAYPQYPPYPLQYNYEPYDALAPARRASVLMFIVGGLLVLGSLCCGVMTMAPLEEVLAQNPELSEQLGASAATLRLGFAIMAGAQVLCGLPLLIMGFFVRNGKMASVILSLIVVSLALLTMLAFAIISIMSGDFGFCIFFAAIGLLVAALVFLIKAMRNVEDVEKIETYHAQQAQYYQAYQQQSQQYYGQPPYQQPPPPPDESQPPPPPPEER